MKIGIVNASSRFSRERADAVEAWVATHFPDRSVSVVFHPASFSKHGPFGGDDATRARAFVEFANDPRIDAVWFARGGYGSCRIAEAVLPRLEPVARKKRYLGFSDAGTLLAGLYKAGFPHVAHGPMASDSVRRDETFTIGTWTINARKHTMGKGRTSKRLTFYELEVLKLLRERSEETVSRDELLEKVWGIQASPTSRTVDNFIVKLRRKLEEDQKNPRHILTVYGLGYKLVP